MIFPPETQHDCCVSFSFLTAPDSDARQIYQQNWKNQSDPTQLSPKAIQPEDRWLARISDSAYKFFPKGL